MVATQRIKHMKDKLLGTGFFNIAGASFINKLVVFACNIVIVRIMTKDAFGSYSFANNIINYFLLFNGLGVAASVVQICVEKEADARAADIAYQTAKLIGVVFDVFLTMGLLVIALTIEMPVDGTKIILLSFLPLPILSLMFELQQQRLRSLFLNKEFARATNVNSISGALLSVIGAFIGSGIGLVVGRCISMVMSVAFIWFKYGVSPLFNSKMVSTKDMKDVLSISIVVCLTNAVSQVLILIGTTIIGIYLESQTAVASYAAATTIPFALLFIPGILQTYLMPYFVRNSRNRNWMLRVWGVGLLLMLFLCGTISTVCCLCAEWLVPLLFGNQYIDSVGAFRVLMVSFVVAGSLRGVSGVALASHRKYVFNLVSSLISLLISLLLTVTLIPDYGIVGAAYGYFGAIVFSALMLSIGTLIFAGHPTLPKD